MPREVAQDGIAWSCVQAFAGLGNDPEKTQAARNAASGSGLRVICTPSGGAKSVALELEEGWEVRLSDADLLRAIRSSLEEQVGS